jgi:hypothetical protein
MHGVRKPCNQKDRGSTTGLDPEHFARLDNWQVELNSECPFCLSELVGFTGGHDTKCTILLDLFAFYTSG